MDQHHTGSQQRLSRRLSNLEPEAIDTSQLKKKDAKTIQLTNSKGGRRNEIIIIDDKDEDDSEFTESSYISAADSDYEDPEFTDQNVLVSYLDLKQTIEMNLRCKRCKSRVAVSKSCIGIKTELTFTCVGAIPHVYNFEKTNTIDNSKKKISDYVENINLILVYMTFGLGFTAISHILNAIGLHVPGVQSKPSPSWRKLERSVGE
jgi:hypothetical protein